MSFAGEKFMDTALKAQPLKNMLSPIPTKCDIALNLSAYIAAFVQDLVTSSGSLINLRNVSLLALPVPKQSVPIPLPQFIVLSPCIPIYQKLRSLFKTI